MKRFRIFPKSIAAKLLLMNAIIFAAFMGLLIGNIHLAHQNHHMMTSLIDKEVPQVIRNASLSRRLNQLFAEIQVLLSKFTLDKNILDKEEPRLRAMLKEIRSASVAADSPELPLSDFSQAVENLLDQCEKIRDLFKHIDSIEADIFSLLDTLEANVTQGIIARKLEGKDYERYSLEQAAALIPDFRSLLLRVELLISDSERDHYKRTPSETDYETKIDSILEELSADLTTVTTAGSALAPTGKKLIQDIGQYKARLIQLHRLMEKLQSHIAVLHRKQQRVIDAITEIDKRVQSTTRDMKQKVVENLESSNNITLILASIVIAVLIGVGVYGLKITRPLRALKISTSEIAAGDLDKTIDTSSSDEVGALARSFVRMRDAIKEKIEELRKFERIVATSKDLMSIVGTDYIYQAVNDALLKAHGKTSEEIVGHSVSEIMGIDIFQKEIKPFMDKCLQGEQTSFQAWLIFPLLGRKYMEVTFYPFFAPAGAVSGIVTNCRDITHTKQLEAQLLQAQKMEAIGTLAGGIAHDFNNILGVIMGYTEMARLDADDKESLDKFLSQVLKAAERARELVQQILTFSRQSEQEKHAVKLAPIIKEALKMLRASIPKTIEIRSRIGDETGAILANPTQVHQVLVNLCTNSAHAMREDGGLLEITLEDVNITPENKIHVPGSAEGLYVQLTVTDTGHGIPANALDRIFDPYYTTKDKGVGTGLGLATVHGIVKSHSGWINVKSTPGEGTQFKIYFPRTEHLRDAEIVPPPSLTMGKGRILFVDDEEALVDVGRIMMERLGYHVVVKTNALDAVDEFRKNPDRFDLVVTDQTMPNMTGKELAQTLLNIRPNIPIILCTGFSELIDEKQAKALGIREFLLKPIVMTKLAETIQKALKKRLDSPPK